MSEIDNFSQMTPEYPKMPDEMIWGIRGFGEVRRIDVNAGQHNWQIEQELGAVETARQQGLDPQEADARELAALRRLRESVYEHGMRVPLNELHRASQRAGDAPVPVSRPEAPYTPLHYPIK